MTPPMDGLHAEAVEMDVAETLAAAETFVGKTFRPGPDSTRQGSMLMVTRASLGMRSEDPVYLAFDIIAPDHMGRMRVSHSAISYSQFIRLYEPIS